MAFGLLFNARMDEKKLKVQAWIDLARADQLGGDFAACVEQLEAGDVVDVRALLYCAFSVNHEPIMRLKLAQVQSTCTLKRIVVPLAHATR